MKSKFLAFLFMLLTSICFGQTFADLSEIKEKTVDGVLLKIYKNKPFSGIIIEKFPNGKSKSWISMNNGLASGLWQEWYENGKLKFNGHWLNGKAHGLWEYYHENGVLRQEEFYDLETPIGIFRDYYNNGQVKLQSSWLNGKKHGIWKYYSENGILTKTEYFENNDLIFTQK